ncbi:MAG TPA: DUF255 domain-containing protein [Candidatus Acidoferrales bacterium]|nr:DUF255 domain-containing protein [Candidatus Acidoferrales bacterium]
MIRFSPNPNQANLIRWHEWGDEAFRKAREQDKPLVLFLTAFWCRYCQRMDEEAFSDNENIALLNAYFISIRADDAQRPDVNTRYNLNGWPTIAFMSPEGNLLAATNYLPKDQFGDVLIRVYMTYQEKKNEIRAAKAASQNSSKETAAPMSRQPIHGGAVEQISDGIMKLADPVHGGYGGGQKFIHPEANDFLLARYEATNDSTYLNQARLTLDRMREGSIHDRENEGYFRTTSSADWSRPHREKLLAEQGGLLANCVRVFRITKETVYAGMAEGIIDYLDRKLSEPSRGIFFGCEDFLRVENAPSEREEFFTIIDRCIYTDANAQAIVAYLEAAASLGKIDLQGRALKALEFLWEHCRSESGEMFHYFDGAPHLEGMLNDQTRMGIALTCAYRSSGEAKHLERAKDLGEFVLAKLKNPGGGYYDIPVEGIGYLGLRLTLIDQNGTAALFFLNLAEATKEHRYLEAAEWALSAFQGDFSSYDIHAASFGQALIAWRRYENVFKTRQA